MLWNEFNYLIYEQRRKHELKCNEISLLVVKNHFIIIFSISSRYDDERLR